MENSLTMILPRALAPFPECPEKEGLSAELAGRKTEVSSDFRG